MKRISNIAWVVAALLTASLVLAAVPQTINYQGYLTNSSGTPVSGPVTMTFSLYTSPTDSVSQVWTETQTGVTVANGRYSVILGSVTPLSVPFDSQYYLGVAVGTDPEMTPRQMLASTPYALRAGQADGLSSSATITTTNQIISTVATGIAPLQVTSTTMVPNLNADMVGGMRATDFVAKSGDTMTGYLTVPGLIPTWVISFPNTVQILQNSSPFIHNYGSSNFFAGINAGNMTMAGNSNTGVGAVALLANTTGNYNTAVGARALAGNTTGYENTAVGDSSLVYNSGRYNSALGRYALYANTTGIYNAAVGYAALRFNTTGSDNTAVGGGVMENNTTGYENTASGYFALRTNTSGNQNTANGVYALFSNTTGGGGSATGYRALYSNTTGYGNTAEGYRALYFNTTGGQNTAAGYEALYSNTTGNYNTAAGNNALHSSTTGWNNSAFGNAALSGTTTGMANTAAGSNALSSNTTGGLNTSVGSNALQSNTTGTGNTAIGYTAGSSQTTGSNNIYLGSNVVGVSGESNITRIGSGQTLAYIAGTINAGGLVSSGTATAAVFSGNGSLLTGITATQAGAVSKAGDTMTGMLYLPANGVRIGNSAGAITENWWEFGKDDGITGTGIDFHGGTALSDYTARIYRLAGDNSELQIVNAGAGPMTLHTNNTARMTIAGNGNIGIGTAAPVAKLEVAGGGDLLFRAAAEDTGDIIFSNSVGVQKGRIWALPTAGAGLYFSSGDSVSDLSIDAAGHVVVSGNLILSATTATMGIIRQGANTLMHTYGSPNNFFAGLSAGNLLMSGTGNSASGAFALTLNSSGNYNTAIGSYSLNQNTTGYLNTAVGSRALRYNTTGYYNTASGVDALHDNTTGFSNTANGYVALYRNTTGKDNTAIGSFCLTSNTTGSYNTASGTFALEYNTSGSGNTANGHSALNLNQTGTSNTAIGINALYSNRSGNMNTASGDTALYQNTAGGGNTASGQSALYQNTFGNYNTAFGVSALISNTTGSYNTAIGRYANVGSGALTNATALGSGAYVYSSNYVRIGNTAVTHIGGQVGFSADSDVRIKKDIADIGYGLSFIRKLRPVQYRLKEGNDRIDFGFIAQDVELTLGTDYNILGIGGDKDRMLSLRYTDFIAPMVKAMQEQQAQIEEQRTMLDELRAEIAALKQKVK